MCLYCTHGSCFTPYHRPIGPELEWDCSQKIRSHPLSVLQARSCAPSGAFEPASPLFLLSLGPFFASGGLREVVWLRSHGCHITCGFGGITWLLAWYGVVPNMQLSLKFLLPASQKSWQMEWQPFIWNFLIWLSLTIQISYCRNRKDIPPPNPPITSIPSLALPIFTDRLPQS